MDATELWILNNKKICTCCGITRGAVVKAIENGAKTVEEINRKTGSGKGSCGGKKCGQKILELLKQYQ